MSRREQRNKKWLERPRSVSANSKRLLNAQLRRRHIRCLSLNFMIWFSRNCCVLRCTLLSAFEASLNSSPDRCACSRDNSITRSQTEHCSSMMVTLSTEFVYNSVQKKTGPRSRDIEIIWLWNPIHWQGPAFPISYLLRSTDISSPNKYPLLICNWYAAH